MCRRQGGKVTNQPETGRGGRAALEQCHRKKRAATTAQTSGTQTSHPIRHIPAMLTATKCDERIENHLWFRFVNFSVRNVRVSY